MLCARRPPGARVDGERRSREAMAIAVEATVRGGGGILAPLSSVIARRIADERAGPVTARDPEFVRHFIGPVARYVRYFSPEVRGLENLPETGPVLVVGNHSCLFFMPDTWVVALAITARRGVETPAYALVYDLLLGLPGVGGLLRRLGGVPAEGREAERVLAEGAAVLVYPGGDKEACRPWTDRNRIVFSGHNGFIRLALRTGVPVVPVVSHGSHDAVIVLSRGERLARLLGLERLRIKVFPIVLGPFGVSTLLTPPLPMPAAVTVEFLAPIDWSRLGPEAAEDDDVVGACYDEITGAMQGALNRLHAEQPHPLWRGVTGLLHGTGSSPVDVSDAVRRGEGRMPLGEAVAKPDNDGDGDSRRTARGAPKAGRPSAASVRTAPPPPPVAVGAGRRRGAAGSECRGDVADHQPGPAGDHATGGRSVGRTRGGRA